MGELNTDDKSVLENQCSLIGKDLNGVTPFKWTARSRVSFNELIKKMDRVKAT